MPDHTSALLRALVIEDEEPERDEITALLSEEGFEVEPARTGREGVDLFSAREYDVIILDVLLPQVDGFEIMRLMRDRYPHLIERTIVVSRVANAELRIFFPRVAEALTKPFDPEEFRAAIRRVVHEKGSAGV